MFKLVLLFIFLLLLLCLVVLLNRKKLLNPSFMYIFGFVVSVGYALFYISKWEIILANKTFVVLIYGALLFTGCASISNYFLGKIVRKVNATKMRNYSFEKCSRIKLIISALIQLSIAILIIKYITSEIGTNNIATAISIFRNRSLSSNPPIAPRIVTYAREISVASGYIWIYIFVYRIINRNKKDIFLLVLNIILSCLNSVLYGYRTGALYIIISGFVEFYFIFKLGNKWKNKFNPITIIKLSLIAIFLLLLFPIVGNGLLGRGNGSMPISDYLAMYISASIKNLDLFIRERRQLNVTIDTNITLRVAINYFAKLFGKRKWFSSNASDSLLVFRNFKGYELGNVYTTYGAFWHDGGFKGVTIYVIMMAVLSQIVFYHAVRNVKSRPNTINISLIVYSSMSAYLFLCFFGAKYFSELFNISFFRMIVWWGFLRWLIIKMRI